VQAGCADARVNGPGEGLEFNHADALAREVGQSFVLSSLLHSAHVHEEEQALPVIRPLDALGVD